LLALAPERKTASVVLIPTKVPAAALDQVKSLTGLLPPSDPTYVQLAAFVVLMLSVQLRFALTVKLGPASAIVAPTSTWSAVGEVSEVVAELIPSLTRAFTETEAVLVVLQLPALPLHWAPAWFTLMADPSTIAARRKRVAVI
jgi:hypothetical protein